MTEKQEEIKAQILAALKHPEAEDGLYLNNLLVVHEEESRPIVRGTQLEVLDALKDLIELKEIEMIENAEKPIFKLLD